MSKKIKTSGNVKVKVYKGSTVVENKSRHNTGTVELCEYLRDMLVGEYVISNRPYFIVPCKFSGPEQDLVPMVSYGVPLTSYSKPESSDKIAFAELRFLIPALTTSAGSEIDGFILFGGDSRFSYAKKYAEVKYVDDPIVVDSSDTNIEVKWTLEISYMEEE